MSCCRRFGQQLWPRSALCTGRHARRCISRTGEMAGIHSAPAPRSRRRRSRIVVPDAALDAEVIRIERLHQYAARQSTASRASRHLGEQLKCALRGAEVRKEKRDIRRDNAYQRHTRQIQPLGNHLRADQNVRSPLGEGPQQLLMRRSESALYPDPSAAREPGGRAAGPSAARARFPVPKWRMLALRQTGHTTGTGSRRLQ